MKKIFKTITKTGLPLIQKYIPHIVLVLCLWTLVVFIFNVNGQGYVPFDDCLRHCAKVISGKPWTEILVLRPEYYSDHNFGWHKLLELYYRISQTNLDGLVGCSVIALFLSATMPMLFRFRRPEAWLFALTLFGLLFFGQFYRFFYGRPYIFAIGGMLLILDTWMRSSKEKPVGLALFTTVIFMLMTYIHGSFYLYIIPVGAFLLAGEWRKFLWLLPCLLIGAAAGILLTGEPIGFAQSQLLHLDMITRYPIEKRYLVGEFRPNPSVANIVLPLAVLLILRRIRNQSFGNLWKDPSFLLVLGMGVLGCRNGRFLLDFGVPAFLLWSARELEAIFEQYTPAYALRRLALTGGVCVVFLFTLTANVNDRWDNNFEGCGRHFPKADDPLLQGWFPEDGGIFYNFDMTFFYNTFAANPHANWRYMLGFEPNVMPDDNLQIYRTFQKENKWINLQPLVEKMKPADRMVFKSTNRPKIEELEWMQVFPGMWFGRLSQKEPAADVQ
jgi:hypothetical protein